MENEKISIIIPCYNSAKSITRCLDGVFSQTYKNIEVIVVDDGSTDDLLVALTNCHKRLTILHQENKGAPSARNYGFKMSTGELLLFLDADIVMRPDMLEKMYLALKTDLTASFAYSSFRWGWKKFKLWPFDYEKLKQMPYIPTSSLIRRESFPGFDESLKKFQDWDLFLTIAEHGGGGVFIAQTLFKVVAKGGMSSWLPSFVYNLPWLRLATKNIYEQGKEIIKKKHNL